MSSSDSGGFWKRVGSFVKNPTRDWSLTDEQALQEHENLARVRAREDQKRQDDFIRKRELDGLRKLRKREATDLGMDDSLQTNVPELTSQPAPIQDRDETLRKINEIEKSMAGDHAPPPPRSRGAGPLTRQFQTTPPPSSLPPLTTGQPPVPAGTAAPEPASSTLHWNLDAAYADTTLITKPGAAAPAPANPASGIPTHSGIPTQSGPATAPGEPSTHPPGYAPTVPFVASAPLSPVRGPEPAAVPFDEQPTLAAATRLSDDALPSRMSGPSGDSWLRSSNDFMPSAFFAVEVHEALSSNPLFDQAVMDFANGDDAAAETALRDAISNSQDMGSEKELWLALFDLFRASGQIDKFEALVVDFVSRFQTSAPMTDDGLPSAPATARPAQGGFKPSLLFSASVDVAQAERLRKLLLNSPAAIEISFEGIHSIATAALPALVDALKRLNQGDCTVTLQGAESLMALCQAQAPAMQREADPQWWALRLELLRLANQQDDFDAIALDYCVTYEISPPTWEASRAKVELAGAEAGATPAASATVPPEFQNSGLSPHSMLGHGGSRSAQLHLSGEILGSSSLFLSPLEQAAKAHEQLSISLRQLRRIDFSSAGALLNWAMMQHDLGKTLQFTGVHRLIAGLFSILGLHEHALIQLRRD
ncbi:STAS domain-containing protein [Thiomonas intermedia]|uniref:STAS domain-containing protein n=1 Tax=Thiomonas intermedia TaxID=926 RepID=UPI0009A528E0|nr:STAS domain-containing protein [Thiomonas intermedia]